MTKDQESRFRRTLEQSRRELLRRIAAWRGRLEVDATGDALDQVRSMSEREFVRDNLDRLAGSLRLVEGALRELDEGAFGVCAACGDPIPLRRLEVVPWSPYCVSCQERTENAARQAGWSEPQETWAAAG